MTPGTPHSESEHLTLNRSLVIKKSELSEERSLEEDGQRISSQELNFSTILSNFEAANFFVDPFKQSGTPNVIQSYKTYIKYEPFLDAQSKS